MSKPLSERAKAIREVQGQLRGYLNEQINTEPNFAGVVFDEIQDSNGRILGLRVVFCDVVGGNVSRRV